VAHAARGMESSRRLAARSDVAASTRRLAVLATGTPKQAYSSAGTMSVQIACKMSVVGPE
jgi:hypothetical protein